MTELVVILVEGLSRTGKTTFCLRYLNARARSLGFVAFIFDPLGVMAATCASAAAESEAELIAALDSGERLIFFDPTLTFPGNRLGAAEWFFRWSYARAQTMPGRKTLFVDEVWKLCSPQQIPQALAEWVQDGAKWGMECLFATQTPNKLNSTITGQLTEVVSFRLQERNALEFNEGLSLDPDELRALQPGSFVALNLFSGGERRGRLW